MSSTTSTNSTNSSDILLDPNQPKPLCSTTNQMYDSQFRVCVSCRDPTVKPFVVANTGKSSTPVNNSVESNISYQCKNNPIVSKDTTGSILSQTCDSGETLTNGKCVITFNAKQK